MNLFVLDQDPKIAAQNNCDKHISKIILEIAQMVANCFNPQQLEYAPKTQKGTIRKHSYFNHPVSIWLRKSKANTRWAIEHAFELERERWHRGFTTRHFSLGFIEWVNNNLETSNVPDGELTPFAVAIAEDKQCRKVPNFNNLGAVEQYRLYYKYDKPFVKWTNRPIPSWFEAMS